MKPYIKSLFKGRNSSILLFGPTSSDKGGLFRGSSSDRGLLSRCCRDILSLISLSSEIDKPYVLKMSASVIYLDKVIDLLGPRQSKVSLDHYMSESESSVV